MSKKPLFKAWGARRATQSRPRKRVQFNNRLRTGEVQESVENHYGVQLVRDRKCGDCAECCTQLPVDSINKPAMTPCSRLNEDGTGCGKYHARFNICKRFQCGWLFGFGTELNFGGVGLRRFLFLRLFLAPLLLELLLLLLVYFELALFIF